MAILLPQTIQPNGIVLLTPSNGSTQQSLLTSGNLASKVYSIGVMNLDTSPAKVILSMSVGSNTADIASVVVDPGKSANLLAPEVLPSVDNDGAYIVGPQVTLRVRLETLPSAGRSVHVYASVANY